MKKFFLKYLRLEHLIRMDELFTKKTLEDIFHLIIRPTRQG